ncbi:MAG: RIP metalloprotease RseP [Niabella sp.]
MTLLAFNWQAFGANLGQFILSFSILIIIHEFGHFITAKWFGCRVEKFYLFFNPWFSLWKKKIGETEYGIGWLPLGGYVKISGMIDESMDKEAMKQPPQPWEFRSKPAWQRLIIMLAGVILNILLAFAIFAMMLFVWGEEKLPVQNAKYGFAFDSLSKTAGFQDGDMIKSVNGKDLRYVGDYTKAIFFNEDKVVGIVRNGKDTSIKMPSGFLSKLTKSETKQLMAPRFPVVVSSDADVKYVSGKLQKGDTVVGVNQTFFKYFDEYIAAKKDLTNQEITLHVVRANGDSAAVKVKTDDRTATKFVPIDPAEILGIEKIEYGFFESIPAGVRFANDKLTEYIDGIKLLFTSKEHKVQDNLGSLISIGKTFGGVWDWHRFWLMTGLFSVILAFMNVLPIPALDGGHALFTLIEMVTGRKPSDKFMEYAQMVGMVLLLGLMAYALGLDIFRLFK